MRLHTYRYKPKIMKNALLILVSILLFSACEKDTSSLPEFRIQNSTPYLIESARVKLGTSEHSYPAIKASETSEYKQFSDYDYPNIKLRVNNQDIEFTIQPIEAPPAGSGKDDRNIRSTAVITYDATSARFSVHFKNE